ncbi:MAG: ABC transporter permease [Candidatus Marinimicrobia bacterium]|nr:ABC transporter permease [Candidatus Neomarinimicrobiota bacterium]MBL7068157.1 ABC transporter permease [Candidatus Neomarinimicrobiota bacterium]
MNVILPILLTELKPGKRTGIAVVINILATLTLYLVFVVGLGELIPRIQFTDIDIWLFPGIIGLFAIFMAFNLALQDTYRMFCETGLIDQINSSRLLTYQIYFIKSAIFLVESFGHLILSSITLWIVVGIRLNVGYLILFWLYYILGLILISQIGMLTGVISANIRLQRGLLNSLVIAVLLCSGVIVPSLRYPGMWSQIIQYFPTTAIIEGGRELLIFHSLNKIYLPYLIFIDMAIVGIGYTVFRRRLSR